MYKEQNQDQIDQNNKEIYKQTSVCLFHVLLCLPFFIDFYAVLFSAVDFSERRKKNIVSFVSTGPKL